MPDPDAVIAVALSDVNKLELRRNAEEAYACSIFGAPKMLVGDQIFWGNDRAEYAISFGANPVSRAATK